MSGSAPYAIVGGDEPSQQPSAYYSPQPRSSGYEKPVRPWSVLKVLLIVVALAIAIAALVIAIVALVKVNGGSIDIDSTSSANVNSNNAITAAQCNRQMLHVTSFNGSWSPFKYDFTGQRGHMRRAYDSSGKSIVYMPRTARFMTGNGCQGDITQPYDSGALPLTRVAFDVVDFGDPENPINITAILAPPYVSDLENSYVLTNVSTTSFHGQLMVVIYHHCSAEGGSSEGIYVLDLTNPRAPVYLSGPFGSTDAGPDHGYCAPTSPRRYMARPTVWSMPDTNAPPGSGRQRVFLNVMDFCETFIVGAPAGEIIYDLTNPHVPVFVKRWQSTSVLPSTNTGFTNWFNDQDASFVLGGDKSKPQVFNAAGSQGWATAAAHLDSHGVPYFNLTAISSWPTNGLDWFVPTVTLHKSAGCGAISPDNRYAVVSHTSSGYSSPTIVIDTAFNGTITSVTCPWIEDVNDAPNVRDFTPSNPSFCGVAVFLGDCCDTVLSETSLPLSPQPYIAVCIRGGCPFTWKYENANLGGYEAMMIAESETSILNGKGPDACDYPLTTADNLLPTLTPIYSTGRVSHAALYSLFNVIPYSSANPALDPGTVGNSVCINGAVAEGVYGYWHLLDASTMQTLYHFAPEEALHNQPVGDYNPSSCPSFDTSTGRPLVVVTSGNSGAHVLYYGGFYQVHVPDFNQHGLHRVAWTPQFDAVEGASVYLDDPLFVPKRSGNGQFALYVVARQYWDSMIHVYGVDACVTLGI